MHKERAFGGITGNAQDFIRRIGGQQRPFVQAVRHAVKHPAVETRVVRGVILILRGDVDSDCFIQADFQPFQRKFPVFVFGQEISGERFARDRIEFVMRVAPVFRVRAAGHVAVPGGVHLRHDMFPVCPRCARAPAFGVDVPFVIRRIALINGLAAFGAIPEQPLNLNACFFDLLRHVFPFFQASLRIVHANHEFNRQRLLVECPPVAFFHQSPLQFRQCGGGFECGGNLLQRLFFVAFFGETRALR